MAAKLSIEYDEVGDILHIDTVKPYPEQESDEIDEGVVARLHPTSGAIENIEVLFFVERLRKDKKLELPVLADLRPASVAPPPVHEEVRRRRPSK